MGKEVGRIPGTWLTPLYCTLTRRLSLVESLEHRHRLHILCQCGRWVDSCGRLQVYLCKDDRLTWLQKGHFSCTKDPVPMWMLKISKMQPVQSNMSKTHEETCDTRCHDYSRWSRDDPNGYLFQASKRHLNISLIALWCVEMVDLCYFCRSTCCKAAARRHCCTAHDRDVQWVAWKLLAFFGLGSWCKCSSNIVTRSCGVWGQWRGYRHK